MSRNKALHNAAKESVNFVLAEGGQILTGLGVIALADQVAPTMLDQASSFIGKTVIQPNLHAIEKGMSSMCRLEECKVDESVPEEERAKRLAHTLMLFGASWVAGMAVKMQTRRGLNRLMDLPSDHDEVPIWQFWKLSKKEATILVADEGVHYGALLMLNTGIANKTDGLIRATTNILTSCGVPEKKAHELAAFGMIWELPNALGLLAGLGAIYHTNTHPGQYGLGKH